MAAPKQNLYALGNNGGRPRIWDSVEEWVNEIAKYFQECVDNKRNPAITHLALYMGFESRQSFYDYENRPEFSYSAKRARLAIEAHYESMLNGYTYQGAKFALSQMGWTEKSEVDNKVSIIKAEVTHIPGVINDIAGSEGDIKMD